MTASRWRRGSALALCVLFSSALAYAQPSAAQKETARGLMAEARELREQGDLQGALTRFAAADSIMGVPTTGFELAATQAELGKLVEARETLRRVLALPQGPDDPEPFNEARSKARALDQRLQSRIGALHFVVTGLGAGEALAVVVDSEAVPVAALGLPFRVNPGKHVVIARAGGREVQAEVDALESRTVKVELVLGEPSTADAVEDPVVASTPVSEHTRQDAPSRRGMPTISYVAGGVGVVGVVVGAVAGISAISHKNAAAKSCVDGNCPRATWSDLDSAHSMATISTTGFVVGAVGLAVGVSALLLREEPRATQRSVRVMPDVGPRGASVSIAGSF
jgi:hypothetical protein